MLEQIDVNKIFLDNLALRRDESDDDDETDREIWNRAVEWTQEDVANLIGNHYENEWQGKQELINKHFFG